MKPSSRVFEAADLAAAVEFWYRNSSNVKWHESRLTFDDIAALGYKLMHVSLAGFPEIKELEAKYLPADEVKNKYEQSVGL